jgi:hypothetical protein
MNRKFSLPQFAKSVSQVLHKPSEEARVKLPNLSKLQRLFTGTRAKSMWAIQVENVNRLKCDTQSALKGLIALLLYSEWPLGLFHPCEWVRLPLSDYEKPLISGAYSAVCCNPRS